MARICSHPEDLQSEIDKIRVILLLNKYPPSFIDRHVGRFFRDLTGTHTPDTLLGKDHSKFLDLILELGWSKKEKR